MSALSDFLSVMLEIAVIVGLTLAQIALWVIAIVTAAWFVNGGE